MTRRSWFVQPDTTRLDLSDDQWIEIKTELNYGESQALYQAAFKPVNVRGQDMVDAEEVKVDLDPFILTQKRMELYLTDWSLRDEKDKPVPISRSAIRALGVEAANEINAAILKHEADQKAKKTTGGVPQPTASSTSATPITGPGQT